LVSTPPQAHDPGSRASRPRRRLVENVGPHRLQCGLSIDSSSFESQTERVLLHLPRGVKGERVAAVRPGGR
jgi:hypothetical protein